MTKPEKSEKRPELEIDQIPLEQSDIIIYDLDNTDKIYKDIIEVNNKIQILKTPSISGSPLAIINKAKLIYNLTNNGKYNKKTQILEIGNGDMFKGEVTIDPEEKNLSLKNGIYTWKTGETYVGSFNQNNQFEGNGKLQRKGDYNSFSLISTFKEGFPGDKSIINIKKNADELYIESDLKKEEKKGKIRLKLDGRTNITKIKEGKEIYRFDGELDNGLIKDQASIKRKYKKTRDIDIYLKSTKGGDGLINMEIEITTTKGDKNFYYKAKYLNGLRVGEYTIQDEEDNTYKKEITKKSELDIF